MALFKKKTVILAKIETTEGVENIPSAATDAIRVENYDITPATALEQTNEASASLDDTAPIAGGTTVAMTFDVLLKGSGTQGTPPEFGDLLKVCSMAETITATAIPVAAQAAAAGSANTLTLGAAAAATAQLYRGMPLELAVNPAAGRSFISDYTVGKLATLTDTYSPVLSATTTYQIPANVLYSPASSAIPSATIHWYEDGVRYRVVGVRGTFSLSGTAGGAFRITFKLTGIVAATAKDDTALPTPTFDATRPPIWRNADGISGAFTIAAAVAAAKMFSLDGGTTVQYPENPNAREGFDVAQITRRGMQGACDPLGTLTATRDLFNDLRQGTVRSIHARAGSGAGNRWGVTVPAAQFTKYDPTDRNGFSADAVSFFPTGTDAGAYICFH